LTPGMIIDCLQKDLEINFNIDRIGVASWTRCLILSINNNTINFKYLGRGEISSLPLNSTHILPLKTLSLDYDWRESLKQGEEIDYLDSKSWYRCTVMSVIERKLDNEVYKYIKLGLRVYRDNGKCKDNNGRRYFGWSENFDKEVSVHDPRVRMPNRYSKLIENYDLLSSYPIESKKFNDLETFIPVNISLNKFKINGNKNFVIPKKSNDFKRLDIEYFLVMNDFCEKGGFEKFLKQLKNKSSTITYEMFSFSVDLIHNIHEYFHFHYAKDFLKEYLHKTMDFLLNFSVVEARSFKKDHLEKVLLKVKDMLYKVYMENDVNAKYDSFIIDFGLGCITSSVLDKKLIGIKYLSSSLLEAIRVNLGQGISSSFNERRLQSNILIDRIKDKNIIELIYGNSSHIQLIQRSSDIVKCLLMCNALSNDDLMKIYELTKLNEIDTKNSIYKILQHNYYYFNSDQASFLIYNILEKSSTSISSMDLELIRDVYKSMETANKIELSKFISENYWKLILSSHYNSEINENLTNELVNILKTFEMRELRIGFIADLVKTQKENNEVRIS